MSEANKELVRRHFEETFNHQNLAACDEATVVAVIFALDVLLIVVGANTWRREEVMARQ